jgi:hypothetical protein
MVRDSSLMPWGRYKGQPFGLVAQDKQYAAFLRRFVPEIGRRLDAVTVTTERLDGGCTVYKPQIWCPKPTAPSVP